MFNNKLLRGLAYTLALLLAANILFVLVMFVWNYLGTPPILDQNVSRVIAFLQNMGVMIFFYLFIGALREVFVNCNKCATNHAGASASAVKVEPIKVVKRVAAKPVRKTVAKKAVKRTTRRVSKKK